MWHRSLICGAVVLAVLALSAAPATATLLSVDFVERQHAKRV